MESIIKNVDFIYIVEDSELDLGFLVSIDRNIVRLIEIICDYLVYFEEKYYENTHSNMETFFGIQINVPIKVRMADAKKIVKLCGYKFKPTTGFNAHVLAFAKKNSNGYTIYVGNGSPKIAAVAIFVHELTHIWQFRN